MEEEQVKETAIVWASNVGYTIEFDRLPKLRHRNCKLPMQTAHKENL